MDVGCPYASSVNDTYSNYVSPPSARRTIQHLAQSARRDVTGDLRRSTHTYSHYKQQLQVTSKQDATSTSSTVAVETRKPNLPCFQTDLPPSESSPEVAKTHSLNTKY